MYSNQPEVPSPSAGKYFVLEEFTVLFDARQQQLEPCIFYDDDDVSVRIPKVCALCVCRRCFDPCRRPADYLQAPLGDIKIGRLFVLRAFLALRISCVRSYVNNRAIYTESTLFWPTDGSEAWEVVDSFGRASILTT